MNLPELGLLQIFGHWREREKKKVFKGGFVNILFKIYLLPINTGFSCLALYLPLSGLTPMPRGGGGLLSGKVGTGMCGPDKVLFRALRFCNGPFFIWKLVLIIGRVFAKCIISNEFFLWFKSMHPNLHCKKHWLVLKRAFQETNGFYIGSKFASSLVLL